MGRFRYKNRGLKTILGTVLFGGFLAGGLTMSYTLATELPLAFVSKDWPAIQGTVTKTGTVLRRKGRSSHWIQYQYEVNGQSYESKRFAFAGKIFSRNTAQERRLRRYREGKPIKVYYDPGSPETAVIEPGVRIMGFLGALFIAGIFIPAGMWGLRATLKP